MRSPRAGTPKGNCHRFCPELHDTIMLRWMPKKGSQGIKPAGNLSTNVSEFLNRRFPQSRRHNCVRSLIIQIVTLKSQNKPLVGR